MVVGMRSWLLRILLVLAVLEIVATAVVWGMPDKDRQERVMATAVLALALAVTLGLVGLVSLGRWRDRLLGTVGLVVALAALAALIRVHGVTGDLVPILAWRWDREAGARLGRLAAPPPELVDAAATNAKRGEEPGIEPSLALTLAHQFRGVARDGVVPRRQFGTDWTSTQPRLVWRRDIGSGFSSFAIGPRGDIYTLEQRGSIEVLACYSLADGSPRWADGPSARFDSVVGGLGPRSTPTLTANGDRVLALGATGILVCRDANSGRLFWQRDIATEHGASIPEWGVACSPLIVDDLVVVSAGGRGRSLVAHRLDSGELAWAGGDDDASYASPLLATLAGRAQIISFNQRSVAAHDPTNGVLLWSHPWRSRHPNVAQPAILPLDDLVVSSGYGYGCERLRVRASGDGTLEVVSLWKSRSLKAKLSNFVIASGHAWGLDDGILVCVDLESGERTWKSGRYGHGQVLLVEDVVLVSAEDGTVQLIAADSASRRELASLQALEGRTWQGPTIDGRLLLHRNDTTAVCWELPRREP
jgi:outer membrane protein assembly factor BamB